MIIHAKKYSQYLSCRTCLANRAMLWERGKNQPISQMGDPAEMASLETVRENNIIKVVEFDVEFGRLQHIQMDAQFMMSLTAKMQEATDKKSPSGIERELK